MSLPLINNGDSGLVSRNKINAGLALLPVGGVINTKDYGAIADGGSHPLSTVYSTLAAAQAVYPFVTALTQEIDWASCKAASNAAFGADGSENGNNPSLNKVLHINAGSYFFGNDTWTIRNLASSRIIGDGQLVSYLTGNSIVLQFDGLWYSVLESFSVEALLNTAVTALDIDGNVPGHPYPTRGVQGVDLVNLSAFANGGTYAFALCRQGGNGAQGSECSYRDVHLSGAATACYFQNGFNGIDNIWLGGDCQNYQTNGMQIIGGNFQVISTSFESQAETLQITNGGFDISCGDAGTNCSISVVGCRTESVSFFHNGGAVYADLRACSQAVGNLAQWQANFNYAAGTAIIVFAQTDQTTIGQIFKTAAGGLSGGIQPTWPATGAGIPVIDNAVTWTELVFNSVENLNGSYDFRTCKMQVGRIISPAPKLGKTVTADHIMGYETVIFADATGGPINITTPYDWNLATPTADTPLEIVIKKVDATANAVTVHSVLGIDAGGDYIIVGGSQGFVRLVMGVSAVTFTPTWNIVGHS